MTNELLKLRQTIKENKISCKEMAEDTGIKYCTIRYYMTKDIVYPNMDFMKKMTDFVNRKLRKTEEETQKLVKPEIYTGGTNTVINKDNVNNVRIDPTVKTRPIIRRGDLFYCENPYARGSVQCGRRPALVVENDSGCLHSSVIKVVFLTTRPKTKLPTHVQINSCKHISIAICEQIVCLNVDDFYDYISRCTEAEMTAVDRALMLSLQLDKYVMKANEDSKSNECSENIVYEKYLKMEAELSVYKKLYEDYIKIQMK